MTRSVSELFKGKGWYFDIDIDANTWTETKVSKMRKRWVRGTEGQKEGLGHFHYWPAIVAAHPPHSNADDGLAVDETAVYGVQKA